MPWTFANSTPSSRRGHGDNVASMACDSRAEVRMACSILDLSWRTCACFFRGRRGGRMQCGSVQNPRETARPRARGVLVTVRRYCGASSPPSTRRRGVRAAADAASARCRPKLSRPRARARSDVRRQITSCSLACTGRSDARTSVAQRESEWPCSVWLDPARYAGATRPL